MRKNNIALVLAGGKGLRMNRSMPKQFIDIDGKPLIVHSLNTLELCDSVDQILIVCVDTHIHLMKEICKYYGLKKVTGVISGGITRHFSIRKGLEYLENRNSEDCIVLIHNANMPLVTKSNIDSCIAGVESRSTITTTVAKNNGYFYRLNEEGKIEIGPDRKEMLSAKVPEAGELGLLLRLYRDDLFSDKKYESYTTGMLGLIKKYNVVPIYCESTNFKITTEEDYVLAEKYLEQKSNEFTT